MQSAEDKLATAKKFKETGDDAFKSGNPKGALASYHSSLSYLLGLDKSALKAIGIGSPPEIPKREGEALTEKTEIDELLEKVYANMSACHIKNGNWKRAQETADKALAKNDKNYKVMFRKAKALGEQGFLERALKLFAEIKEKNPTDAQVVDAEVARFKAIDKERDRANKEKLKGFLIRKAKPEPVAPTTAA